MPFKTAVDTHLESLDSDGYEFKILQFLRKNALGASKAKGWPKIKEILNINEEEFSKEDFQHGLVSSSRVNKFYICSNNRGYYIPDDVNDVAIAKHYYESRIESMLSNLNNLIEMSNAIYPDCNFPGIETWLDEVKSRIKPS